LLVILLLHAFIPSSPPGPMFKFSSFLFYYFQCNSRRGNKQSRIGTVHWATERFKNNRTK
ncbi:MAG: hypothetical protein WCY82_10305, partial [Desulfotomaculaceae bacterium]